MRPEQREIDALHAYLNTNEQGMEIRDFLCLHIFLLTEYGLAFTLPRPGETENEFNNRMNEACNRAHEICTPARSRDIEAAAVNIAITVFLLTKPEVVAS